MSQHLSLCLGSGCSQGNKETLLLALQSYTAVPSLWDLAIQLYTCTEHPVGGG